MDVFVHCPKRCANSPLSCVSKGFLVKVALIFLLSVGTLLLTLPSPSNAAPSGKQVCKKMIAEGRANVWSLSECQCQYRVADVVLDEDIKTLLFDSWYNGTNNMKAVKKLPNQRRVLKQLKTFRRSGAANCE